MIEISLDDSAILRAIARSKISSRYAEKAEKLISNLSPPACAVVNVILGTATGDEETCRVADWFLNAARSDFSNS